MLTLDSILRTTRHMAANGETAIPVPRDRQGRPRSPVADPSHEPVDLPALVEEADAPTLAEGGASGITG